MGLHTYIKRLRDYVSGSTGTFVPLLPASTVDTDTTDTDLTIGTYTIDYRDTFEYISASDFVNQNGDGTGLAELWRYRTQFDINPNTTGVYPTTVGTPASHPTGYEYPGRPNRSPFSLREATRFLARHTLNHTATGNPPYKFSDMRGAEAFYLTFVRGVSESEATRALRRRCHGVINFIKRLSWCLACRGGRWAWIATIVVGIAVTFVNPAVGISIIAMGTSVGVATEKTDKKRCYVYTYTNNASFTVRVNGGYSPTEKFLVTLSSSRGLVREFVTKAGVDLTFSNLRSSDSGQDGFNLGSYTLRVMDVITKQSYNYDVFVPYEPRGNRYGITAKQPGRLSTYNCGPRAAPHTYVPSVSNAHWAYPNVTLGSGVTAIVEEPFQAAASTCNNLNLGFFATIAATTVDVNWKFRWQKTQLAVPGTVMAPTVMTDVDAWVLETAANLTFNRQISADVNTAYDATSGVFQLQLSSAAGGIITINTMQNEAGVAVPAIFELFELGEDDTASYVVDLDLDTTNFTAVQARFFTGTFNAAGDPLFNYVVTVQCRAACCDQIFVECREYEADLDQTWWDPAFDPAFAANAAAFPAAPVPDIRTVTLPGNMVANLATFTFNHNNVVSGTRTFTYVVRGRPATIPSLANEWVPDSFSGQLTVTDTDVTPPVTTIERMENYRVLTLT
jgi:hypothetical protein